MECGRQRETFYPDDLALPTPESDDIMFMLTRPHDTCSHSSMKTISLTEEAYERLKSWKDAALDSFSKVVLAKVPKKFLYMAFKSFGTRL